MKKKLIVLAIVSLATVAGTSKANAQKASNGTSLEFQKGIGEPTNPTISPRALRNFADNYKDVKGESWMKVKDGFAVRFSSDDTKSTILYNKKGEWVGSIKYYHEEKMRGEIRHIVKSSYYDYKIVYTQEVETSDSEDVPTYIVCLEDKSNIKFVRISAGEMSVWK
ncbi:MAG TPA: hypothetical protein VFU29_16065, partial [Chitinophagaceae bacterium]|nr:hypothetical protein [Chitinophagaceae bacterium]